MFKIGPKYDKLKSNLKLASNRLKIFQAKTLEQSEKLKLEIANCVKNENFMIARIKAQNLIRDDATVEALELVELYCEQLLERYELFRHMREPEESLLVPISNLIWVTPYFQTQIEELKFISKQLVIKYGLQFCKLALTNKSGKVSLELIQRVKFKSSDDQTENCLKMVCKKYGIDYEKIKKKLLKSKKMPEDLLKNNEDMPASGCIEKNENNELVAEGMSQVSDKISSKKTFKEIMLKTKSNLSRNQYGSKDKIKGSRKALNGYGPKENGISEGNSSRTSGNTLMRNLNESIMCTAITSRVEYGENCRTSEEKSGITSSLDECTCSKEITSIASNDTCTSQNYNNGLNYYPEPPPSYNEVIFNNSQSNKPEYGSLPSFQIPTCPMETPDDQHTNCETRQEKRMLCESD